MGRSSFGIMVVKCFLGRVGLPLGWPRVVLRGREGGASGPGAGGLFKFF